MSKTVINVLAAVHIKVDVFVMSDIFDNWQTHITFTFLWNTYCLVTIVSLGTQSRIVPLICATVSFFLMAQGHNEKI